MKTWKNISKWSTEIETIIAGISAAEAMNYLNRESQKLANYLSATKINEENLHEIRKELKLHYYNLKSVKIASLRKSTLIEQLDAVQQALG